MMIMHSGSLLPTELDPIENILSVLWCLVFWFLVIVCPCRQLYMFSMFVCVMLSSNCTYYWRV